MTTRDTTEPSASRARHGNPDEGFEGARQAVRAATAQVGDAVDSVRASLPEVARASRELAGGAIQRIESGSDQQISAGATMSLGLAIGMLLGGAPRFLIALALVPVAAIGLVMLERRSPRPGTTSR
jgi:hypothetical protein